MKYKKLQVGYNKNTDIYKFRSRDFGQAFVDKLIRGVFTSIVSDNLFNYYGPDGIDFYGFFIPEVHSFVLEAIEEGYIKGIDSELLQEMKMYLEEEIHLDIESKGKILNMDKIKEHLTKTPLEHQIKIFETYEGNKKYLHYRGLLLDVATGGGKTFSAIALAEALEAQKIIVVAPLAICNQVWVRAVTEVVNKNDQIYKVPQKYTLLYENKIDLDSRYFICSNEWIPRIKELQDHFLEHKTVFIVDESHNFGDPKSKRTLALIDVIDSIGTDDVILLSGTPIKSYLHEFINILRFLDKRFKGDVEERFTNMYKRGCSLFNKYNLISERYKFCSVHVKKSSLVLPELKIEYIDIDIPNAKDYLLYEVKAKMVTFLEKRLKELLDIRPESEEACFKLIDKAQKGSPNQNEYQRYREIIKKIARAHDDHTLMDIPHLLKEATSFENQVIIPRLVGDDRKDFRYHITIYKYPILKAQGEALGQILLKERVKCFSDIAAHLDYLDIIKSASKKTLIFSDFINVCEAAYLKCKKTLGKKYEPMPIYGDSSKIMNQLITKFRNEPKVNPLITTYKLLGTGVELKEANVVILINVPYRVATYNQTISRCWRQGQDKKVHVFVPILQTGEQHNLTTRNVDIFHFFNREVESITGIKTDLPLITEEIIENLSYERKVPAAPVPYDLQVSLDDMVAGFNRRKEEPPYDIRSILQSVKQVTNFFENMSLY